MLRHGHHLSCGTASCRSLQRGLSIEDISHLVGHANTCVTESIYRKEPRWPVLTVAPALWTHFSLIQRPELGKHGSHT